TMLRSRSRSDVVLPRSPNPPSTPQNKRTPFSIHPHPATQPQSFVPVVAGDILLEPAWNRGDRPGYRKSPAPAAHASPSSERDELRLRPRDLRSASPLSAPAVCLFYPVGR